MIIASIIAVLVLFAALLTLHMALMEFATKGMSDKELEDYYAEMMRQNYLNNKNNLL